MESGKVEKKWYVLQAFSGFENKVKQTLEDTIKREGLEESFGEILVPTEEVLEIKEGQKKRTERKYFPGYVMIKMDLNDHTWHMVKSAPKVLGFVGGTGDKPIPLGENEAQTKKLGKIISDFVAHGGIAKAKNRINWAEE